jgi:hypothetical protein
VRLRLKELVGQVISARLASPACARAPALSTGSSRCQASIVRGLQFGRPAVVVVEYGLIREHHFYWDQLEFLGQLGLLPEGNK